MTFTFIPPEDQRTLSLSFSFPTCIKEEITWAHSQMIAAHRSREETSNETFLPNILILDCQPPEMHLFNLGKWVYGTLSRQPKKKVDEYSLRGNKTLGIIKFCKCKFSLRGILSQNDWPETTRDTNPITIKPKIESHMAEQFWISLPCTWAPLPNKLSCFVSRCVSSPFISEC